MSEEILSLYGYVLVTALEKWNNFPRVYSQTCSAAIKGTAMQIKKTLTNDCLHVSKLS